jgi:hypothetical protein
MSTSTQCRDCNHYLGERQCEAFPAQIPEAIYLGEHDHAKPYPGDHGIRFEPLENEGAK